mgnify:CR=1 FL=1
MSKLLFNEQPLVIDKQLASLIGLNEAMVLQQIHYWIEINKKVRNNYYEGKYWTYNTIQEWQKEFPFWSYDTVKRTLAKLRKQGMLITGNFNKLKIDRTIWYTIDYDLLERLNNEYIEKQKEENAKEDIQDSDYKIVPVDNFELDKGKSVEEDSNKEADIILGDEVESEKPLQTLKFTNSAKCPNAENPISADCPNAIGHFAPMHQGKMPSPLPEISTETSSEISKSISLSLDNINNKELKTDRQIDKEIRKDLINEYNQLIERLELDYLDDKAYKDAVTHALKLLYLDIENKKRIRIGENLIPSEIVRNDLKKINCFVIDHAIDKFKVASREKEIRNSVSYLKSCIYNSIHELDIDVDSNLRFNGII